MLKDEIDVFDKLQTFCLIWFSRRSLSFHEKWFKYKIWDKRWENTFHEMKFKKNKILERGKLSHLWYN